MIGFIRVNYKWRITGQSTPPATIPCYPTSTAVSKDGPLLLSSKVIEDIHAVNSEQGARFVLSAASGWVNRVGYCEPIVFGGSVHQVSAWDKGRYLIERGSKMQFTCVNLLGQPRLPANGLVCYVFALAKRDMWISEKDCVFSTSPLKVIVPGSEPLPQPVVQVTLPQGTKLHQRPNGPVVAVGGGVYDILGYSLKSWAQVGDKRWVNLENPTA